MPNIAPLLDYMRSISVTEREKGDYFERAIVEWIKTDPVSYTHLTLPTKA